MGGESGVGGRRFYIETVSFVSVSTSYEYHQYYLYYYYDYYY